MSQTEVLVTPTLVADQVYDVLRNKILTGDLAAGFPLRVRDVATMVGTSVMPVREAIRRLEETGLATRVPHRGAIVKEFTASELIHIYEVREILEVEAARRGADRITDEAIAQMEIAGERMQLAVNAQKASDALDEDEFIHRTIYNFGGNPVLIDMIENLWLQCRPYKYIGANEALKTNDSSLWTSQREIIEAAKVRDADAVATLIYRSLQSARERLERRLFTER